MATDDICQAFCGCFGCQQIRPATSAPAAPVTIGELIDALSTYPRDAPAFTGEAGTGTGTIEAQIGDKWYTVWAGHTSAGNWHAPETIPFDALRPRPYADPKGTQQ